MEDAKIREPTPFLKPNQVELANGELEYVNLGADGELKEAIRIALPRDPIAAAHLESPPEGFIGEEGLLWQGGLVYIPKDTEITSGTLIFAYPRNRTILIVADRLSVTISDYEQLSVTMTMSRTGLIIPTICCPHVR